MEKNKKIQKLTHGDMEALFKTGASQVAQRVKNLPAMQETWVRSLGGEEPLEKALAPHSSILAWKIPWTEELSRIHSIGLQEPDIT